jgi:hypothetical protein
MRHFSHRQMVTSPQLGQGNLTALSPGRIVRAHHEHVGIRMTFSLLVVVVALKFGAFGFHTHSSEGYKLIAAHCPSAMLFEVPANSNRSLLRLRNHQSFFW